MHRRFPELIARDLVARALEEDLGARGDITTRAIAPPGRCAEADLVAREDLVVAGMPLVAIVMDNLTQRSGGEVLSLSRLPEGDWAARGAVLARLSGPVRHLLGGERVLLNFLGRLTGIATLTAQAVAEVAGTGCKISDTRKTTPGLRALEKYAVVAGGGESHRGTLDGMVLVKDNHKFCAGGLGPAIQKIEEAGHALSEVEVEVESLEEVDVALAAGVGWILLDNMGLDEIREAAKRCRGRAQLEVSGGMRPGRLRPFAEAGVQRLSLGCLTHGARSMDVALDIAL